MPQGQRAATRSLPSWAPYWKGRDYGSGPTNDTQPDAQDLTPAFRPLLGSSQATPIDTVNVASLQGKLPSLGGEDWYQFTLPAGESGTVAVAKQAGAGTPSLQLYDQSVALLADGISAFNADSIVSDLSSPSDGTYYAHV